MCDLLNKYETNLRTYMDAMWGPYIFFEITKCCGYSQFIPAYRDGTLKDLHRAFSFHFGFKIDGLLVKHDGCVLDILSEDMLLKDFIRLNPDFFKPIYPLPAKVVYNIYFVGSCCGCTDAPVINEEPVIMEPIG